MLGLSIDKFVVIAVIAAIVIGPQRLPSYVSRVARLVRTMAGLVETAKAKAIEEVPELADIDWVKLDPRRYDPRRIVRDALEHESSSTEPIQSENARSTE